MLFISIPASWLIPNEPQDADLLKVSSPVMESGGEEIECMVLNNDNLNVIN